MLLTEIHNINKNHPFYKKLDQLCFLSKNLYNYANYIIRQEFINTTKEKEEGLREHANYLNYNAINRMLIDQKSVDYYALPCKVSNQILMQLDKNWKSFFKSIKEYKQNPSKYKGRPKLPNYKHKTKGRNNLIYELGAISKKYKKTGKITLSGINDLEIPFININNELKQARIIPTDLNVIKIEIIYKIKTKKELELENLNINNQTIKNENQNEINQNKKEEITNLNKKVSIIDLGVNNLMTLTFNLKRHRPVIINGRPLKSINQYFNKKKAEMQSKLPKEVYTSNSIKNITKRRNNKIKDYLHKSTNKVISILKEKEIELLVVGKNDGWKQEINIGSRNNQNFVSIPYNMLINMLKYKCFLNNIEFDTKNESHTSKCSFIDNEKVCHHDEYMGKRIKRGMFRSANKISINADVNGSYNIMTKVVSDFKYEIEGIAVCPVKLNVNF